MVTGRRGGDLGVTCFRWSLVVVEVVVLVVVAGRYLVRSTDAAVSVRDGGVCRRTTAVFRQLLHLTATVLKPDLHLSKHSNNTNVFKLSGSMKELDRTTAIHRIH